MGASHSSVNFLFIMPICQHFPSSKVVLRIWYSYTLLFGCLKSRAKTNHSNSSVFAQNHDICC